MIIKCPGCGCRYELQRRPPATFRCRKCSFTVPFQVLLNEQGGQPSVDVTNSETNNDNGSQSLSTGINEGSAETEVVMPGGDHTRVVPGLAGAHETVVVQALQPKRGALQVVFDGHPYSTIPLPYGSYDLGRLSSDSRAKVKIAPDMAMSRLHAGMRTTQINGHIVYQITSVKNENPVYVNDQPVPKGKACSLKNGDRIRMGNTIAVFRLL